ncbi:putative protein phosphatase 2C 26 [Wolffia australiana]
MGNGCPSGFCLDQRPGRTEGRRFYNEPWLRLDATEGHGFRYIRRFSFFAQRSTSSPRNPIRSISGAAVSSNCARPMPSMGLSPWDEAAAPASASNIPGFVGSSSFYAFPLRLWSPAETEVSSSPADPDTGGSSSKNGKAKFGESSSAIRRSSRFIRRGSLERTRSLEAAPLQWARGKAGEDQLHVVVSEEQRWLFVGIYDGFNGSEASEFLVANLYKEIFNQLERLCEETDQESSVVPPAEVDARKRSSYSVSRSLAFLTRNLRDRLWNRGKETERTSRHRKGKEKLEGTSQRKGKPWMARLPSDPDLVLGAFSKALEITEGLYLATMEREIAHKPEIVLSGSCLLVALIKDDDLFIMNLGDSRAIVGQQWMPRTVTGKAIDSAEAGGSAGRRTPSYAEMTALQVTTDHNTSTEAEVRRIKEEHPEDQRCVENDKVKGRLKLTRAFGAGNLKRPEWNDKLLSAFRSDYIGRAPYLSSSPSVFHRKITFLDKFLILSSDGLFQYLSNEEVVWHVKTFEEKFRDDDPTQSIVRELIARAADSKGQSAFFGNFFFLFCLFFWEILKKSLGKILMPIVAMDFHDLLAVPRGDRRNYHDDVTVVVVSLEEGWSSPENSS